MSKPLSALATNDLASDYGPIAPHKPIVLRPVHEIVAEQREPDWLIHKVLERSVLAVLAGPRSTFKSFIALEWAMRMAWSGHAGVILSGEGGGLCQRIEAWMQQHGEGRDLKALPLVAHERPLSLNVDTELDALRVAIDGLPGAPAFIVIDTFSKFSAGIDENSNSEVAEFLSRLSARLREDLNCTVLLVAHSGHGDSKRPRGASSLMANPDAEYIVDRADSRSMIVTVSRERFKDTASLPPLGYEAKVINLGRLDSYGEYVSSLALVSVDAPPPLAKGKGRNQEKFAVALREWARANPAKEYITSADVTDICKAQRIDRKRRREVLDSFVNARALTHSVGGYAIHVENL